MVSRARARTLVGVILSLAIVVPLGSMWWNSLLPSSYSVMNMGYADYGGGPRPQAEGHHHMQGMEHVSGGTSVTSLDTPKAARPDVTVDLTAREGTVELASGKTVEGYTINGTSPGPTIEATVGQLVEVRLHNEDVEGGVALHWHGVDVPNAQDGVAGVTQDAVKPGEDYTYRWVAPHAGTFWYHSHQMSNEQVSGGLLGGIVIRPAAPDPGVIDQLAVAHLYDSIQTLNGDTGFQRVSARPGQRVRVRVVNTDNGPQKAWANVPYKVVSTDGYDVNQPTDVTGKGIGIPSGGRVDLELTVPDDETAARVEVLGEVGFLFGPDGAEAPRVRQPEKQVDLLDYGSPADTGIDADNPDRDFEYSIGRKPGFINGRPGMWWSINGHLYPDMPMAMVREGEVVKFTISSHTGDVHPMHLHGHHAHRAVAQRQGGDRQPVVVRLARRAEGRDLRDRLRGGQPRHLDGPLPQPQARGPGHGHAPDVRRRDHAVQARLGLGQRAGVTPARAGGDTLCCVTDPSHPAAEPPRTVAWIDASAGVSGAMFLGALVGAGAPVGVLAEAMEKVAPGEVLLDVEEVRRGEFSAHPLPASRCPTPRPSARGERSNDCSVARDCTRTSGPSPTTCSPGSPRPRDRCTGSRPRTCTSGSPARWTRLPSSSVSAPRWCTSVSIASSARRCRWAVAPFPPSKAACRFRRRRWSSSSAGCRAPGAPSALELCTPIGTALLTALADGWGPQPAMSVSNVGIGAGAGGPGEHVERAAAGRGGFDKLNQRGRLDRRDRATDVARRHRDRLRRRSSSSSCPTRPSSPRWSCRLATGPWRCGLAWVSRSSSRR